MPKKKAVFPGPLSLGAAFVQLMKYKQKGCERYMARQLKIVNLVGRRACFPFLFSFFLMVGM